MDMFLGEADSTVLLHNDQRIQNMYVYLLVWEGDRLEA